MFSMQADLMRALGDGTRLAIFERLCDREHTVNELAAQFPVSQPAVSQHLGVLKRCGLVSERRSGRFAHYRGRPEGLQPLVDWIGHYRRFWPEKLRALEGLLAQEEAAAMPGEPNTLSKETRDDEGK
jgi:DNA-binding transcriptional ArsR family regulator